ncbi:putative UDP-glucoronosyl and UDP-glucosyl transferase [Halenospora varia]|nr:putative UDP-glucoronosyl and UDP-glucosyl transferase [Halenospora varia]
MEKQQNILFITNSELGQASVILAVAHEFLIRPEYKVHIASFSALKNCITELNDDADRANSGLENAATFHVIAGKSMREAAGRATEFLEMHPHGMTGALYAYDNVLPATFAPWDGPKYMEGVESCIEIIKDVQPDIVAVDPLFSQGVDACNTLGQKCLILSPNTLKELVLQNQPGATPMTKFPAMASGFPYPLPWYYVPANIYLIFRFLKARRVNPRLVALAKYREEHGIAGKIPCMFEGFGDAPILLPSTPEIDYDFKVPQHATPCGPILRPFEPISKTHPDMERWLKQRPTVLVNLGSHILFDPAFAGQFAAGLRVILDRRPDIQILWKLKTQGQTKEQLFGPGGALEIIVEEIKDGRVRIEDWLPAQPIAILESGHVCCMVHHGGANSYHEAIQAGVPQIVLPVWIDTYDFALRVEHLGIGAWGNSSAAPRVEASELGKALARVVDSNESASMATNAKILAEPFRKREGRVVAFEKIVELLES